MSPVDCTIQNGVCFSTYSSPEISGIEKIKAEAKEEPDVKDETSMTIMVPGLTVLGGGAYDLKRATATHPSSYWATTGTYLLMDVIARDYQGTFPNDPILTVTEGSLEAGGLFDYQNTWAPPHKAHREGRNVDVRSHRIAQKNRVKFERIVSRAGAVWQLEFKSQGNEHYRLAFPN